MGGILAVANQKGGVGKTTTAVSLAAAMAMAGRKVLLVDMDPQGNATSGLGIDRAALTRHVYQVLIDGLDIHEVLQPTSIKSLSLAPAARDLTGAEVELGERPEWEYALADRLRPISKEFDVVLIDCPPSLGRLTVNAMVASDGVLVPLQSEYYAMEGLSELVATIESIRAGLNPNLVLAGIILTMYDGRTNLARQIEQEIRSHFGELVFQTVIPRSVRLAEAPSHGMPIVLYDIRSTGAGAYLDLSRELLRRYRFSAPARDQEATTTT
ncbi:MAG TPA: ParA family protein [bacterium]|nr:ParA family protein [bacterium]